MAHEGNGSKRFRVIFSGAMKRRLKDLAAGTFSASERDEFLETIRMLVERLKVNPQEVGEPLFHYRNAEIIVHVALLRRVKLAFGIHESLPLVWISEIDIV